MDDRFQITAYKSDGTQRFWYRSSLWVSRIIADKAIKELGFDKVSIVDRYGGFSEVRTAKAD